MQLLILLSAPLLAVLEFVLIFGLEIAHTPRTAAWLRPVYALPCSGCSRPYAPESC